MADAGAHTGVRGRAVENGKADNAGSPAVSTE
jgi:hypothetical protein